MTVGVSGEISGFTSFGNNTYGSLDANFMIGSTSYEVEILRITNTVNVELAFTNAPSASQRRAWTP